MSPSHSCSKLSFAKQLESQLEPYPRSGSRNFPKLVAGFEDLPLINASRNLSLAARYTHELGSEEVSTWENRRGLK